MSKSHLYKVNDDGTLTLPTGERMLIIDSSTRKYNSKLYFNMIPDSPFGETITPLRFYKKTCYKISKQLVSHVSLTELIIPPKTQFHVENGNLNNFASKFRFERAIVGDQTRIAYDDKIMETSSIYDCSFKYLFGELVEPTISFYDYNQWSKNRQIDATSTYGIHAFQSREQAMLFYF